MPLAEKEAFAKRRQELVDSTRQVVSSKRKLEEGSDQQQRLGYVWFVYVIICDYMLGFAMFC